MTGKRHNIAFAFISIVLCVLCVASVLLCAPTAYATEGEVTALSLNSDHPEENVAFYLPNLLPGDSATGYYSLSVSYTGTIQVCFAIESLGEDAMLADALTIQVISGNTGATLYEGPMGDMPVLQQELSTSESAKTEQLSYTIIVSLPTSAGNEYQNKRLTADFSWWAECESDDPGSDPVDPSLPTAPGTGGGGLVPGPGTGDSGHPTLWLILAIVALLVIIVVFWIERRSKGKTRFLSILLVLALLIGGMGITTAALQYYKQTVDGNIFQTGTVKINLNDNKPIFDSDILVEPGMELHTNFTVRNEGTADCYYKLLLSCDETELAEQLEVKLLYKEEVLFEGTLMQMAAMETVTQSALLRQDEEVQLTLVLHMPETAGNALQNQITNFDVQVQAVQAANNPSRLFD